MAQAERTPENESGEGERERDQQNKLGTPVTESESSRLDRTPIHYHFSLRYLPP